MTMPWGSTEEPTVMETGVDSIPVHVVSTDAKPGKSAAAEFGRWRTFVVSNVVGPNSITPGAQRIASRSLRRHRLLMKVNGTGSLTSGGMSAVGVAGSVTSPAAFQNISATPLLPAGTYVVYITFNLSGTVTAGTDNNNIHLSPANAVNGTPVLANNIGQGEQTFGPFVMVLATSAAIALQTGSNAGTVGSVYSGSIIATPQAQAQSLTDGVIVGSKEEICSGSPAIPGQLGGYLQIGDNYRWEVQQELWVCYPQTNSGPVYLTVCDEVYASAPDAWKDDQ